MLTCLWVHAYPSSFSCRGFTVRVSLEAVAGDDTHLPTHVPVTSGDFSVCVPRQTTRHTGEQKNDLTVNFCVQSPFRIVSLAERPSGLIFTSFEW